MLSRLLLPVLFLPAVVSGQSNAPDIAGTWKVDATAEVKEGPREVVIRADSSASWGKEIARWRLVKDKIWIALGGEWEIYTLKATASTLTLSGGGLKKAVVLRKSGPATPLPEGRRVPPAPADPPR